jgi:hypothetical protein
VQCHYGPCLTAYHPYCAFINGISMASTIDSRGFSDYCILCRKHDTSAKTSLQGTNRMRGADSGHIVDAFFSKKDKEGKKKGKKEGKGGGKGSRVGDYKGSGLVNKASPPVSLDSPLDGLHDTAIKSPRSAAWRSSEGRGSGLPSSSNSNSNTSSTKPTTKR